MGKWADRFKPAGEEKEGFCQSLSVVLPSETNQKNDSAKKHEVETKNELTKVTVTDKTIKNNLPLSDGGTDKTDKTSLESDRVIKERVINLVRLVGIQHNVLFTEETIFQEFIFSRDLETASLETLRSWATGIAYRLLQKRGLIPNEWDKIAHCKQCGDVHSWHDLETLSCSWCWLRVKGDYFPQP